MRHSICALLLCSLALAGPARSQTISGVVTDETGAGLPAVTISLPAVHRGTVTDTAGVYSIPNLHHGIYTIEFMLIGYGKETRKVTVETGDVAVDVKLSQSTLELPGIIVTGKPQPTDVLSSPQPVSSVDGRELSRERGQSIMQSLSNSPGVTTFTTGAGIAKPVIRGLTSQRVLVVDDGTRQEGQQWGDEHGPEIDAFDVERIEVLRGPGSVLYGSDAIGGVVNVVKYGLPTIAEGDPGIGGRLTMNGFSNNDQVAGNLSLFGAGGAVGYRASVSGRNAGDISTPEGRLANSGMEEVDAGGMLGVEGDWGTVEADYTLFRQKLEIHEDPAEDPEATPFQKIGHDKVHLHADIPFEALRFEMDGGWQQNVRREFEEAGATDAVLHLVLKTLTFDARAHHHPVGPFFGTVGLSVLHENNETLAEEKLIPGFEMSNIAGYLYEEARFGAATISAGARYDSRVLDVDATEELNVDAQRRTYNAVTGTVGATYRISEPFALGANVGVGWRSPSAFELFVDGVHEGTIQYIIGDPGLGNERSVNTDLSVRYGSGRVQGEITGYRNTVDGFIYSSPTGEIDSASGFQKYQLKQADALLTGVEISIQAQVTSWLVFTGGYDFTRANNEETDTPLPLIPPGRVRAGTRFLPSSGSAVKNPYVSVGVRNVFEQDRIEAYETSTPGYTLVEMGVGGEIGLGGDRMEVDILAENLFDEAYADHLSRYKDYALNMGRNVSLKVTIPFTISH